VIHSFACLDTEALFYSLAVPRFKNIERVARRKLLQLHADEFLSPGDLLARADVHSFYRDAWNRASAEAF
jgi:hypothetical protein